MMYNQPQGEPFPQQPGSPSQPYAAPQPYPGRPQQPVAAPPLPQQARPRRKKRSVGLIALAVIVLGLIAAGYFLQKGSPDYAAVGDCVAGNSSEALRVVECTDPEVTYKVVGKVEDKSQFEFHTSSATICKPFPEARSAFWKGERGGSGYVLCLAPAK